MTQAKLHSGCFFKGEMDVIGRKPSEVLLYFVLCVLEVNVYASGCMLNSVVDLQPMLIPVETSSVRLGQSRERGDIG